MDYAQIARLIEFARTEGAESITVDIDPGVVTLDMADALQLWDELAPGEPYEIKSINWK